MKATKFQSSKPTQRISSQLTVTQMELEMHTQYKLRPGRHLQFCQKAYSVSKLLDGRTNSVEISRTTAEILQVEDGDIQYRTLNLTPLFNFDLDLSQVNSDIWRDAEHTSQIS